MDLARRRCFRLASLLVVPGREIDHEQISEEDELTVQESPSRSRASESLGDVPGSDTGAGRLRGRLTEWIALAVIIGLVVLGSWNWAGEAGPPPELSDEDLRTLEMLRTLRDVDVDVELMMTSESPDRWILDRGFDAPEEDATWMTAAEARLEFTPVGTASAAYLFVYPFVSDSVPVRQLTLESSAGTVEATLTGGGQVVGINLDSSLQDQVLTLRCDRVDSPEDLGLGSDIRPLCLKLISVRLEP